MMKKLLILIIAFSLISVNFVKAESDIVNSANNWLISKGLMDNNYFLATNENSKALNTESYLTGTRKTIVYGTPHGDTVEINGGTRNRYLGYTMSGANFTNYMYPDDTSGASSYYSRGYNKTRLVKEPWKNPKTRIHFAVISSEGVPADILFCDKAEFEPYIKEGLRIRSRDEMNRQGIPVDFPTVDYTKEQIESTNWYEYTYIIQPPTDYSWGSGVLFRDGGAGYLTIPIPPNRYGETPAPTPTNTPTPIITATPIVTPTPTPTITPTIQTEKIYIDGFWNDNIKFDGSKLSVAFVRAPRQALNYYKMSAGEKLSTRIKVYVVNNIPIKDLETGSFDRHISKGKLVFDEVVNFTKDSNYFYKKITFDPPSEGNGSGVIVDDGITIVSCHSTKSSGKVQWRGTHGYTMNGVDYLKGFPFSEIK